MASRPQRRSGNLSALKVELWACIRFLSTTIANEDSSRELRLRACSAMAANAGVYRQLLETSDLEERLTALEQQMESNHHGTIA
jgi:hypothetical protein